MDYYLQFDYYRQQLFTDLADLTALKDETTGKKRRRQILLFQNSATYSRYLAKKRWNEDSTMLKPSSAVPQRHSKRMFDQLLRKWKTAVHAFVGPVP